MGTVNHEGASRMYSWWWNSHICPKNSKWLLENLADMDDKVKQMIKLIEEDADSFARRAEMFYKKRPELMKLVEEFYRAYRALAERYDHATAVIHQAHKTMAAAFPNQVPTIAEDDLPADSPVKFDTCKSGMTSRPCSSTCTDDLPKDSAAKALSRCNSFSPGGGRESNNFSSHHIYPVDDEGAQVLSEIELMIKNEMHIQNLREAMSVLEDEKKAFAVQCQLSSERILNLEAEIARAGENLRQVTEQANESEREIKSLKIALTESDAINEEHSRRYQESMDIINNLKNSLARAEKDAEELKSQANKNELEVMILKQNLGKLGSEKESALLQYKHCLEMVSDLENKLQHAEKTVIELNEQSNNAKSEAQHLKEALAKMTEEKEAADFRCHSLLEMNSCLESKFSSAQDEVKRLKLEIETQFAKLQTAEEKCLFLERSNQALQLKQESLLQKMETQNEELSYKQKELGRLWTCIQEERLRLMEKETALQNLQHLHFQSQEDVRSLTAKLQNSTQIAKDMETCNRCLQEEIQKVHEENKNLKELNLSSSQSIQSLNDEISKLKEKTLKLEEDTELQYKQRAIHEQEISCLKEELDGLKKNHGLVQEQVDSTRWNGECINSSVKMLQDENSKLKEICDQERSEKLVLVEILAVMDKLLERNVLLEDSLSNLNEELDQTREKVKDLEVSCESLIKERSALITERASLVSPLQIMIKSLEELEVNNSSENIAFDVNLGLEGTRVSSKRVNASLLLSDEELDLVAETKSLAGQLGLTRQKVEDMVARYQELEGKYLDLEDEKETMLLEIAELQDHLEIAKGENSTSATKLAIDRETIDENFRIQSEHFLSLQNGMKKVMEMNEELKSEVLERVCNEELKNEIGNLNIRIADLQHAFKCLQEENCKVLEEEHSLKTKVLELEEDKSMLQEDNDFILCETLNQGIISLVFQGVIFEQVSKLNELNRSLEKVSILKSDLKEKLKLMEENFLKLQMTNLQLMKSPEKSDNDIKSLRSVVDLLCCDMAHVRDLLCLKEKKFLEAEKQDATEAEKNDLMKELDNLKMVYNEIKLAQEDQQKKILELSVDHLRQIKESGFSNEVKRKLETDLRNLQKRNRELKLREQSLISLLHVQNTEFAHWELQVASFLDKLIMANIREAFLEDKNREINESCWRLTEMKEAEIKLLKESLNSLVGENDRLTSHLAMYASALVSLRDCVSSLEIRTGMHKANYKIFKDVEVMTPLGGSQSEAVQKIRSLVPEGFLEMQDIQLRIKAIEEAILEMDGPSVKEKSNSGGNLEAAARRLEEGQLHLETVQANRQVARRRDKERLGERFSTDPRMHKPTVQISHPVSEPTKDIVLDQDSGCSSYRPRRRGTSEADDRMLELWETTDMSGSIDLKVGKAHKVDVMGTCDKVEFCREHSTPNSSRELLIVKEVGVDNLEISENSASSRRGRNKRKILDKLASDAQKLTNLQITVKDLKRKVETTEQGRIGRSIQCSNLKDQLEEAEATIMKSFDANYKLMSSTEDSFMSSNTKSNEESEGCGNIRRKISEQVKKESEKIDVLQSEVQKIQFQLVKLDDEKESRGRTRITERKTRILLKDYLSVRVKNNQKRKKAPCCACVPARRN